MFLENTCTVAWRFVAFDISRKAVNITFRIESEPQYKVVRFKNNIQTVQKGLTSKSHQIVQGEKHLFGSLKCKA